ncbi:DUF4112 domain-containing protein [Maricaulis sp.]|uniref:DUF4112 domain-containing protein n=1 Tax=Maricaulis sp. TaxID=1486257 RepID=UPI0026052853|nr:DUF4112 domain-containing protein [Maricaulis sp.]
MTDIQNRDIDFANETPVDGSNPSTTDEARASAHAEAYAAIRGVEDFSDRLIPIGKNWGIGADALVGLVPGVGGAYSLGAGGVIIANAIRAGVSLTTILGMVAIILFDVIVGAIIGIGDVGDVFIRGHAIAGRMARDDIKRLGYIPPDEEADESAAEQTGLLQSKFVRGALILIAGLFLFQLIS